MEKIILKIAGFGVPSLILIIAISATGLSGAAAVTAALAAIGPGGMICGVFTLVLTALITEAISKYGVSNVFNSVVKELYRKGETKETITNKIEKYPISKDLKRKLKENLQNM